MGRPFKMCNTLTELCLSKHNLIMRQEFCKVATAQVRFNECFKLLVTPCLDFWPPIHAYYRPNTSTEYEVIPIVRNWRDACVRTYRIQLLPIRIYLFFCVAACCGKFVISTKWKEECLRNIGNKVVPHWSV